MSLQEIIIQLQDIIDNCHLSNQQKLVLLEALKELKRKKINKGDIAKIIIEIIKLLGLSKNFFEE